MATYNYAPQFRGQKLTSQVTATGTEDVYIITQAGGVLVGGAGGNNQIQISPQTAACLYHTSVGLTATDGKLLQIGQTYTFPVGNTFTFYIRASGGAGTLELTVV